MMESDQRTIRERKVLLTILLITALIPLITVPYLQLRTLRQDNRRVADFRRQLSKSGSTTRSISEAKAQIDSLQQDLLKLTGTYYDPEITPFYTFCDNFIGQAQSSGLSIVNYQTYTAGDPQKLTLQLKGNIANILRYLSDLAMHPKRMNIPTLSINHAGTEYSLNLTLEYLTIPSMELQ